MRQNATAHREHSSQTDCSLFYIKWDLKSCNVALSPGRLGHKVCCGTVYTAKEFIARVSSTVALVVYCWIYVIILFFFFNVDERLRYNLSALFHFLLYYLPSSGRIHNDGEWNLSLFSGSHGSIPGLMRNCKTPRKSCPIKTLYKTISCFFFLFAGKFLSYPWAVVN